MAALNWLENYPQFDALYVVSDLHLGGHHPRLKFPQIFNNGKLFQLFVKELLDRHDPAMRQALLINGDTVDFLAETDADFSPIYFDPDGAIPKLERIRQDSAFKPVWDALADFVARDNCHLILTIGNHDLELALPEVQNWLIRTLGGDNSDAVRGRVTFAMQGEGFGCRIGKASVYAVHGNDVDEWNYNDYESLRKQALSRRQDRSRQPWNPNAGTRLVVEVMNRIKPERQFVDLLKPEIEAVLPALAAMESFRTGIPNLVRGGAIAAHAERDRIVRAGDQLGETAEAGASTSTSGSTAIGSRRESMAHTSLFASRDELAAAQFERVNRCLRLGMTPFELLPGADDAETLGMAGTLRDIVAVYWAKFRQVPPAKALWEALKDLASDESFRTTKRDFTYESLNNKVSAQFDFLLTGHTHFERAFPREPRGFYYNTGTWVRRIRLTPEMLSSEQIFAAVYEALSTSTLEQLDGKTIDIGGRLVPLVLNRPAVVSIVRKDNSTAGKMRWATLDGKRLKWVDVPGSEHTVQGAK